MFYILTNFTWATERNDLYLLRFTFHSAAQRNLLSCLGDVTFATFYFPEFGYPRDLLSADNVKYSNSIGFTFSKMFLNFRLHMFKSKPTEQTSVPKYLHLVFSLMLKNSRCSKISVDVSAFASNIINHVAFAVFKMYEKLQQNLQPRLRKFVTTFRWLQLNVNSLAYLWSFVECPMRPQEKTKSQYDNSRHNLTYIRSLKLTKTA